ncbi:MAG: CinA family protein [Candidatus Hydrogenedentes bacterium]|nr:CinA family protein [Candidatus Hydrogenedentota bacterium]
MPHRSSPENRVISYLIDSGKTIATAESCSGGLIAHRLTNVPGASTPFIGGIVAYSNAVKMALLAVPASTLEIHGAVSEETARAMAGGARKALGSDIAVAVTGIAGPGGGTAEKPVGLVYMAVAGAGITRAVKHQFQGDRESIKTQTADAALNLVWESLNS